MRHCTKCYSPRQPGAWDLCTPDTNYSYNIAVSIISQSVPCVENADETIDLEICILKLPDLSHAGFGLSRDFYGFS